MDQRFNYLIDKLCTIIPRFLRAFVLLFSKNRLGWHLFATGSCIKNRIRKAFLSIHSEEDADLFITESAEKLKFTHGYLKERLYAKTSILLMIDANKDGIRFSISLLAFITSSVQLFLKRTDEICWISLAVLFQWLSAAMYTDYKPISDRFRQRYLAGSFLNTFSYLCLLFIWFKMYLEQGIANNIILQSSMLILMFLYFTIYFVCIAFNKKQLLVLRIIELLLGMIPTLATATAISLAIARISSVVISNNFNSVFRLMSAGLLFISDRVEVLRKVSLISIPISGSVYMILYTFGMMFLLISA